MDSWLNVGGRAGELQEFLVPFLSMCTTLGIGENNMRHHVPWVRPYVYTCSGQADWSGAFEHLHVNEGWQLSDFHNFLGRHGAIKACLQFPQLVQGNLIHLLLEYPLADRLEDSDFGPVSKAILAKREAKLRELISLGYDLGERDRLGWTPLHLSVYWPLGMEILLAAGVRHNGGFFGHFHDFFRVCITPLEYAIKNGQDEAILLLLDADSVAYRKCDDTPTTLASVIRNYYEPSSRIVTATLEAMVRKSNRLRDLAIAHLSPHELDRLCISCEDEPIQILDAYAVPTVNALKNVGVEIPEALEPGLVVSTVYHGLFTSYLRPSEVLVEFAERLWSSGFRDTNIYDEDGFTPLHKACVYFQLGMVNWLMSHGGDPTIVVRGHSLNAYHLHSHGFKDHIKAYGLSITGDMVEHYRDTLTRIAGVCGTSCRDDCRCACSLQGCAPTTILLRQMPLSWCEKEDVFFSWCRSFDPSLGAIETWCLEFARVETFERLDITHTCCKTAYKAVSAPIPQDTIEEIQDEESEMIDQLESWMILYEEERAKFEGTAIQFLDKWSDMLKDEMDVPAPFEEYWRQRSLWDEETRMPDYFAKPSSVEHGHEEVDEDQE